VDLNSYDSRHRRRYGLCEIRSALEWNRAKCTRIPFALQLYCDPGNWGGPGAQTAPIAPVLAGITVRT